MQIYFIINTCGAIMTNSEIILKLVNEFLEKTQITKEQLDTDLSTLGLNSIKFIQLIIALEEEFECEIPDDKLVLSAMNTTTKIIQVINSLVAQEKYKKVL